MTMHLLPKRAPARVLGPIVGALARSGVTPNQISVVGFLGNVGAAALIANGLLLPAGILVLFASALDMLDGGLARATGRATPFGGVLDSTLDRLSEATVLFGVLWYEIDLGNREEALLCFAAVVGSLMVSYIRARVEAAGGALTDGLFTRSERVVVTGVALIFGWLRPALWLLAVLTLATAAQRLYLAADAVREANEER
ncbi:MAG: CDP-alcohol phosphatidyltransferase family protein [Dehalococcoidia bacterium]